jgi:hypothetical protein
MSVGGIVMKNEIQFRVFAEDHIRARLKEAENYRMLNQLRKCYPGGISWGWRTVIHSLGRSLVVMGEKLEGLGGSLARWFELEGRVSQRGEDLMM